MPRAKVATLYAQITSARKEFLHPRGYCRRYKKMCALKNIKKIVKGEPLVLPKLESCGMIDGKLYETGSKVCTETDALFYQGDRSNECERWLEYYS